MIRTMLSSATSSAKEYLG
jgi:hypothetical protein